MPDYNVDKLCKSVQEPNLTCWTLFYLPTSKPCRTLTDLSILDEKALGLRHNFN